MPVKEIPPPIASAAVGLLKEYVPDLNEETLSERLTASPEARERTDRLLTRKEAAAALSISIPTLDRLLANRQLQRVKIRGAVRVPESAIQRFITG